MRQLNYKTCNTGVAFSNGYTTGFGFFSLSRRKLHFLWRNPIFQLSVPQQMHVERCFTLEMILTHRDGGTLVQLVSISLRIVTPYFQCLKPRQACENSSCCFLSL